MMGKKMGRIQSQKKKKKKVEFARMEVTVL